MPDISVWEKVLRAAAVYFFLLMALRVTGKRQVGQLTSFDLVVLLILSNVVQNALIGNDNSLLGGLIGAAAILAINFIVVEIAYRFKPARRLMEAAPALLVHNGRILQDNLRHERLTKDDLMAALRKNGIADVGKVRFAVLEDNGQISVVPNKK